MSLKKLVALSTILGGVIGIAGCNKTPDKAPNAGSGTTSTTSTGDAHSGWWCDEHGVPEEICALCNTKVAADLKAKGDWCKQHDRPESQCFICHPDKEAEFAAQYEAKYGKKPPKPEGGEGQAKDDDAKS